MKKKNKILLIVAVVLIVLMAALAIILRPQADAGNKSITVNVVHLNGET